MIIACSTTTLSRSLCSSMQTFSASWQLMLSLSAAATPVKMHRNLGSWQSKRLYWRSCAVTSLRSNVSLVCQDFLHFQHSCNFKHCSMSWGALVYDSDSQISCTFGHNRPSVKPLFFLEPTPYTAQWPNLAINQPKIGWYVADSENYIYNIDRPLVIALYILHAL